MDLFYSRHDSRTRLPPLLDLSSVTAFFSVLLQDAAGTSLEVVQVAMDKLIALLKYEPRMSSKSKPHVRSLNRPRAVLECVPMLISLS